MPRSLSGTSDHQQVEPRLRQPPPIPATASATAARELSVVPPPTPVGVSSPVKLDTTLSDTSIHVVSEFQVPHGRATELALPDATPAAASPAVGEDTPALVAVVSPETLVVSEEDSRTNGTAVAADEKKTVGLPPSEADLGSAVVDVHVSAVEPTTEEPSVASPAVDPPTLGAPTVKPPKTRKKPKRNSSGEASESDVREPAVEPVKLPRTKGSKRAKKPKRHDPTESTDGEDASTASAYSRPEDDLAISEGETKDDWLVDSSKAKVKPLIKLPGETTWMLETGAKLNFFDAFSPRMLALVEGDSWDDFSRYFYQQEHFNFITTIKNSGELMVISVLKQPDAQGHRVFIRANTGDKRASLPASPAHVLTTAKDFKAALEKWPQLDTVLPAGVAVTPILEPIFPKQLLAFERKLVKTAIKVGVVYRKQGQKSEDEILGNDEASEEFYNFMECIADKISLQGWDKYDGGLDTKDNKTGKYAYHATYQGVEVMFHVSTLLPKAGNDPEEIQEKKKAHIGNDYVVIVFVEGDEPFSPHTLQSKFNHVFIVVRKLISVKKKVVYQISVSQRASVGLTQPTLPADSLFERSSDLRSYVLAKVVNSERTAIMSALAAQLKSIRTQLMNLLFNKYKSSGGCCGGKSSNDDGLLLFE